MGRRDSPTSVEEQQSEEMLSHVVKDAAVYTPVKMPGSLQPAHLFPPSSAELVLLTLPDVVNPMSLINSEVVVGGRKDSLLLAEGHRYRVATYPTNQDSTCLPSLFLPDQDGQLTKVTSEIKAFLVVKGEVEEKEEDGKNRVDIEALRSVPCKLPKDLQRRDFLGKSRKVETLVEFNKQAKRKKKSISSMPSLDNLDQQNGKDHSPRKKKRSMAVSPCTNTSGSPTNKEKHKVLFHSDETGSNIKKTIKMENSEPMRGDTDALLSKGKRKIRT